MPLLVDGKPYEMTLEERERFSRDIIYHVPTDVVRNDEKNKRLGVPTGWGIECQYVMYDPKTKKRQQVVYYESSFFDDTRKRDIYAPTHFILPPTGHVKIYAAEAEKNWFLMNHPGNFHNPVRNHESRPYARVLIQFHTHDPNEKAKRRQERTAYLYKVLGYVQSGLATSWKYHELRNACEVLVQEAGTRPLPYDLINYQEFDEEQHEVLRAALADVAYNDALWVYSRLIEGKHTRIAEYLRLVKNTDVTGFGYDKKNHNFFFKAEDGENEKGEKKYKKGIFINVPEKKDPDKFLFDCCLTTPGFFERIVQIVEESKQKELA